MPLSIKQQLQNDSEFRLNFVKNHIINGRLFFSSISSGQQLMINTVTNSNRIHIAAYPNGVSMTSDWLAINHILLYANKAL